MYWPAPEDCLEASAVSSLKLFSPQSELIKLNMELAADDVTDDVTDDYICPRPNVRLVMMEQNVSSASKIKSTAGVSQQLTRCVNQSLTDALNCHSHYPR